MASTLRRHECLEAYVAEATVISLDSEDEDGAARASLLCESERSFDPRDAHLGVSFASRASRRRWRCGRARIAIYSASACGAALIAATAAGRAAAALQRSYGGEAASGPEGFQVLEASPGTSCDRCPVGRCDRGPKGEECYWWRPPIDPGAYHCRVKTCDEVPPPRLGISGCWQYNGQNFYSVAIEEAPCRAVSEEPEQTAATAAAPTAPATTAAPRTAAATTLLAATSTTTVTPAPTTTTQAPKASTAPSSSKPPASERRPSSPGTPGGAEEPAVSGHHGSHPSEGEARAEARGSPRSGAKDSAGHGALETHRAHHADNGRNHSGSRASGDHKERRGSSHSSPETRDTPRAPRSEGPAAPPPRPAEDGDKRLQRQRHEGNDDDRDSEQERKGLGSIFDSEVLRIISTPHRDVRLAAYWDIGDCGPGLDDQNVEWCGGLTFQPKCKNVVQVNTSVCVSEHASLLYFSGREGGRAWVRMDGCEYEYFAEYSCLPITSTSTSTTTTTSTSTSTTTKTTTSTSSTTFTGTTTSTTSTTVLTTTASQEVEMMQRMFDLELPLAMPGGGWKPEAGFPDASCTSEWRLPPVPNLATEHNGVQLNDVCMRTMGPHYVYVIGDWGGVMSPQGPKPADQRQETAFVHGVDDRAQLRVAAQMRERAKTRAPDYILNAGDNFYWSGLNVNCGLPSNQIIPTGQFEWNYEKVYTGEGIDGKPWLSVLGNHDYGGYMFNKGWDQQIAYTWSPNKRWMLPGQYWRQKIRYPGFSVDYFFVDTQAFGAEAVDADPEHNICSKEHVPPDAGCGTVGPETVDACPGWFRDLWAKEKTWLEQCLAESKAEWQIVVTHYPPTWGMDFWLPMTERYGIDLFVSGHVHSQAVHHMEPSNPLRPTAYIVSGGGGGITSDNAPHPEGHDDQYGFFELTLSRETIQIQSVSHGGFVRSVNFLQPRGPHLPEPKPPPRPRRRPRNIVNDLVAAGVKAEQGLDAVAALLAEKK